MTRRKKLAISVVALLALAAAGVLAIMYLAPTMHGKFERLRDGMTYDEVVAILGCAERRLLAGAGGVVGPGSSGCSPHRL